MFLVLADILSLSENETTIKETSHFFVSEKHTDSAEDQIIISSTVIVLDLFAMDTLAHELLI